MTDISTVLRAVAPRAHPAFVAASAAEAGGIMARYGIITVNAQAMLIAQMTHESGGLRLFEENLNYSAAQLRKTWPGRFDEAQAAACARKPKQIALKVYNGRMGNRTGTEDGWVYRGSNALQHTGASEFARVEKRTGLQVVANPDRLRDPANAIAGWNAACSYFIDRGVLAAANAGDVTAATKKINGGTIGLSDREVLYKRAVAAFNGHALPAGKTTVEQSDDAKKRAKQVATTAAPAAAGGGGATKQGAGADWATAIGIGLTVALVIGIVALIFWRQHKAKVAAVETMQLQTIDSRLAMAPA